MNKDIDLKYGDEGENRVYEQLCRIFGPLQHLSKEDQFSEFDFKNERFYVEVKRRRNTKLRYPTTMVGENKVIKGLGLQQGGYRVFFAFDFVDKLCLWELNRDEYEVAHGGRTDRGKPEIKSYCFVHTNFLMDVIDDGNEITAERPQAGIHHQEAIRQAPGQDAGRHHPPQQEGTQETGKSTEQSSEESTEEESAQEEIVKSDSE